MKNLLITAPYFIKDIDNLKEDIKGFNLIIPDVEERLDENQLLEIYSRYDISGTICGDDDYSRKVLDNVNELKIISKWGTGIDSINKKYANSKGIKVTNTLGSFTVPVSQTTIGLILTIVRGIHDNNIKMSKGQWEKVECSTLDELTIGIIGHGRIGKKVASILKIMGANVIVNDIKYEGNEYGDYIYDNNQKFRIFNYKELLNLSDIVSIHCDLNSTSYHLIDKCSINMMKDNSILINTARGKIIKEEDLIDALKRKKIKSCGLDVYEREPLDNSELMNMDNVIKLSHNSNNSRKYWDIVHKNTIKNLLDNI